MKITLSLLSASLLSLQLFAQSPGGVSANLTLWYKADGNTVYSNAGTTNASDGGTIQQWNNSVASSSYHLTQATAGSRPTYYSSTSGKLINFNPAIEFNAGPWLFNSTAFAANTSPYTFITASTFSDAGNGTYRTILDFSQFNDYWTFGRYYADGTNTYKSGWTLYLALGGGNNYFAAPGSSFSAAGGTNAYYNGTNYTFNTAATQMPARPSIASISSDGATNLNTYIDDIKGIQTITNTNTYRHQKFAIGAETSGTDPWRGLIPEVIGYTRQLSDAELNRVHSYLALKYGITLGTGGSLANINNDAAGANYTNSSGTVVWSTATNAGYNYNIAGIIRDDNSALNQKQSTSIIGNQQVIIGNGTSLTTSNAQNGSIFSADQSSLIWGDNNLSTAFSVPVSGVSGVNNRMARVWKVQETGSVGTVTLAWPSNSPTLKLLVSSDPTFSSGVTDFSMGNVISINGINYSTVTLDFTSGQYFTFARYTGSPGGISTNLTLWYKAEGDDVFSASGGANQLVTNGTTVQQWNNSVASSNYHLTQATAGSRPTYYSSTSGKLINFNPTIEFNAGPWLFNSTAFAANTSPYTFITASTFSDAGNGTYRTILDFSQFNDYWSFERYYADGTNTYKSGWTLYLALGGGNNYFAAPGSSFSSAGGTNAYFNGTNYTFNTAATQMPARPSIASISSDGATNLNTYIDDIKGTQTITNTNTYRHQKFAIGAETPGSDPWRGLVPEVVGYTRQLSDAELNKVHSYLALKYGITLGTGGSLTNINNDAAGANYTNSAGTVVWSTVTNAGYNYNIAGIIRDDDSELMQKQSATSHGSGRVIIGNGTTLSPTNSTNTNNLSSNLSSLVWGDNNLAMNFSTAIGSVSGVNFRMARVWKIQETGAIATIVIACPSTSPSIKLLVSNDPTFSSGITSLNMTGTITIDGYTYSTVTLDLNNGEYFTFARYVGAPGGVASNMALWFNADSNAGLSSAYSDAGNTFVQDGGRVQQWNNNGISSGYNLTQLTAGSQPTFYSSTSGKLINFNPTIEFNAGPWLFNSTAFAANTSPYTFITASTFSDAGNGTYRTILDFSQFNDYWSFERYYADGTNTYKSGWTLYLALGGGNNYFAAPGSSFSSAGGTNAYFNGTNYTFNTAATQMPARPSIASISSDGATNLNTYIDDIKGTQTITNTNTYRHQKFAIGAETPGSDPWRGLVPEVVGYTRQLSDAELNRVHSYFAIKYGITLGTGGSLANINNDAAGANYTSASGTVVWSTLTNTGYNYNIAGIARDDSGELIQTQSKAQNADDILTIYLGNVKYANEGSNPARYTFPNNSFFVSGTNNAPVLFPSTPHPDVPSGISYRLQREWKAQLTNFSNTNLTLEFDLSGYSLSWLNANALQLLIDDDGTFATGASIYGNSSSPSVTITVNGQIVTVSGIDASWFTGKPYYTLGAIDPVVLPVELTQFETECVAGTIVAKWETESEKNSQSFTLEKSINGQDWVPVAMIKAAGESSEHLFYTLKDETPYNTSVSYYRLNESDIDGFNRYYYAAAVPLCLFPEQTFDFVIYPNPSEGRIHLISDEEITSILVTNLMGQKTEVTMNQINKKVFQIDDLNKGVYLIHLTTDYNKTAVQKVIIH